MWRLLRQKFPSGQYDPPPSPTYPSCDQEAGAGQRGGNGNFQTQSSLDPSPRALHEIQPDGANHPLSEGSVFGLTGEALANLVRDAAKAAGLGDGFTGRIGMARRMVAAGASTVVVQH